MSKGKGQRGGAPKKKQVSSRANSCRQSKAGAAQDKPAAEPARQSAAAAPGSDTMPPSAQPAPMPLVNLGNTCFFNSTLQVLTSSLSLSTACVPHSCAFHALPGRPEVGVWLSRYWHRCWRPCQLSARAGVRLPTGRQCRAPWAAPLRSSCRRLAVSSMRSQCFTPVSHLAAMLACLVCNRLHSKMSVIHIYYRACKCACGHRGQEGRRLWLKMAAARGA